MKHSPFAMALVRSSLGIQSRFPQEGDHFVIERRISIEDGISIRTAFRESLAQLLHDPLRCRVTGHVEVQNRRRLCSITKKQ